MCHVSNKKLIKRIIIIRIIMKVIGIKIRIVVRTISTVIKNLTRLSIRAMMM